MKEKEGKKEVEEKGNTNHPFFFFVKAVAKSSPELLVFCKDFQEKVSQQQRKPQSSFLSSKYFKYFYFFSSKRKHFLCA